MVFEQLNPGISSTTERVGEMIVCFLMTWAHWKMVRTKTPDGAHLPHKTHAAIWLPVGAGGGGEEWLGLYGVVGGMTMIKLLACAMRSVLGGIAAVGTKATVAIYCGNHVWPCRFWSWWRADTIELAQKGMTPLGQRWLMQRWGWAVNFTIAQNAVRNGIVIVL